MNTTKYEVWMCNPETLPRSHHMDNFFMTEEGAREYVETRKEKYPDVEWKITEIVRRDLPDV